MTSEAIIMMVAVLTIVWGGFIAMLLFANNQKEGATINQGENSESKS
jgi:flagellar basal body-associated protein FliL